MGREELAEALASAVERHAGQETTRRRMFGGVSILLDGRIDAWLEPALRFHASDDAASGSR